MDECLQRSLNGNWQLIYTDVGTGTLANAREAFAKNAAFPCPVPGDVHMALIDGGIIPEPLEGCNSLACRWLEEKEFWYGTHFAIPADFPGQRMELCFDGLDLTADIWLNGTHLGRCNNAFIRHTLDVTKVLKAGENELIVRIDDGVAAVKDKPLDFTQYAWNNEQPYRAWMRKPQFVYGWDWTIWLPSCGIWKDVTLLSYREGILRDVHVDTALVSRRAELTIHAEVEALTPGSYTLECKIYPDSRYDGPGTLACVRESREIGQAGKISWDLAVALDDPQLWWPNGAGRPYLYTLEISLLNRGGSCLHRDTLRHGIRTVSLRELPLEGGGTGFTYVINGEPIFCKGANHVPADCLPGRITREKTRALLEAAADMHMNMIRVWGGSVYESEDFMALCDELGLMVWHDFMFACAYYPDHVPEFYEEIRREATAAIRRLRRHTSLVGWSGNNEIQEMYTALRTWNKDFPWYGGRLYEELLPQLVAQLCPDRIYRESSPFGGDEPTSYDQGDQHTWHFTHRPNWEHYLDLWRFTDFDFKFLSEFGIIGAMNLEAAKKCIPEEALHPGSEEWKHHTNSSSDHTLIDVFVKTYFPQPAQDVQGYILQSQVLQGELMRHVYDELRSRKFRCSGILLWTLSDSYGIHNWSVIDYYLGKRPVYYYLKRAMAPVNLSFMGYEVQSFDGMVGYREACDPIRILAANDQLQPQQATLRWRVMTFGGQVLREETQDVTLAANAVQTLAEVDISSFCRDYTPEETILHATLTQGEAIRSENRYFFAPYGTLRLRDARVRWEIDRESGEMTLVSDTFVWMLHLPEAAGITYSDNDFDLLPGEARTIRLGGELTGFVPRLLSLNPSTEVI